MRKMLLLGSALGLLNVAAPVQAQVSSAYTVSSCGSESYPANQAYPITQSTAGNVCTSGGGGGGGGGTSSNFGSAFPTAGTAVGFESSSGSLMSPGNLDSSGNLKVDVAAGGAGGGAVYGPTANGSPAANPPILMGGVGTESPTGTVYNWLVNSSGYGIIAGAGTAGTAAGGVLTVQGVSGGTNLNVNIAASGASDISTNNAQWGGTAVVTGGVNGSVGVGGQAANNASTAGYPVPASGLAENAEPTLATNGQNAELALDLAHKLITLPYANPENFVEGSATVTSTTSTSLIASGGTGLYIYVTGLSCFNSGATGVTVSLQNGSGGTAFWEGYAAASGGGFTEAFPTPIGGKALSTATAVYFAAGGSTSSLYCNASGYKGS